MRVGSSRFALPFAAALLLTACEAPRAPGDNQSAPAANAAANDASGADEGGPPAGNVAISYEAENVEFRYSWPEQAGAIPELDGWLRGNAERLRTQTVNGARQEQAAAKREGYVFNGFSYTEDWRSVGDLPALLVMQSEGYSYTGGAHGMPVVTVLFWDKAARARLPTGALFDLPVLHRAIRDRFCKALDAEREERRGEPVVPNDPDQIPEFVNCVDIAKQAILPVSKGGRALDTIRVIVMPYEAGSYAEGIYEIDLPVDAAVRGAVRPDWKAAFSPA